MKTKTKRSKAWQFRPKLQRDFCPRTVEEWFAGIAAAMRSKPSDWWDRVDKLGKTKKGQ